MTCSNCQGKVQYKGANGLEYTCGKCRIAELEKDNARLTHSYKKAKSIAVNLLKQRTKRDEVIKVMRDALVGMVHEYDKLCKYGSDIAKNANSNYGRAKQSIKQSEELENKR